MPLEGLGTKSIAPSSSARRVLAVPSRDSELTITIGRGLSDMINSVACRPSMRGILMSMVTTSGLKRFAHFNCFAAILGLADHLHLRIAIDDVDQHFAHER